jgi:hypothetical protein
MSRSFDDIHIGRPELARLYLELLGAQPGRPLALFAPRRVGKTFFLDHDLAPAAVTAGLQPVYADLWLSKSAPLEAINHALEEALDDAQVPKSAARRVAKTHVRKVGVMGASIELGDEPKRRALPARPDLRLDALVQRLRQACAKPVLLLLDEVQTIGDAPDGEATAATLRAVLHKRRGDACAVLTGSSKEGLARMLSTVGAPMYQFAQVMDFPRLGDEYLLALAQHFRSVHPRKRLDVDALRVAYERLGQRPGVTRDLVKAMSADGLDDIALGLRRFLDDPQRASEWRALLDPLPAIDRAVLRALAGGRPPLSAHTLDEIGRALGERPTVGKVRASMERLRRTGLVHRDPSRAPAIDDPLLVEYLRGQAPGTARRPRPRR